MTSPTLTARVLVQALPYIQRFTGKSVVVKLGGAAIDAELDRALAQDVLLLRSVGVRCVLVHGGGPQVDSVMRKMGKQPEFRDGLRVTDAETLEIVRMVLVGGVNRDLVATINRETRDDPVAVRRPPSSPATPTATGSSTVGGDVNGQPYNINADEAAMAIAVAMGAEKIVYLTAAPGLLEDAKDEESLIPRLSSAELRERIAHESVSAGMIPKLRACADAVDGGVGSAHIIDGRVPHALLIEILTDEGIGTMVKRDLAEPGQ